MWCMLMGREEIEIDSFLESEGPLFLHHNHNAFKRQPQQQQQQQQQQHSKNETNRNPQIGPIPLSLPFNQQQLSY